MNMMNNTTSDNTLFDRVVSILEEARGNVVRAVNTSMVTAYWLIGREIVQELQGGDERAEYGKQVVEKLAVALTRKYGKGFSAPTLWKFRQFYQVYYQRLEILSLTGTELGSADILSPSGIELKRDASFLPGGSQLAIPFSPQLSWSHYRALMRVKDEKARDFYEQEAIEGAWSKDTLERQIHTQYYERVLKSQQPKELIADGRQLQKKPSLAMVIFDRHKRIFNRERCETREKSKNPLATFSVFSGLKINHRRHAREMILNRERRETREKNLKGLKSGIAKAMREMIG